MRRTDGPVPIEAQEDIKDTLRAQGYFLACRYHPDTDIKIDVPNKSQVVSAATVVGKENMADDICRLLLEPATPLYYHAGQYINLQQQDGFARSYSLASVPAVDEHLELHIRRMKSGRMSNWIHDDLKTGDQIEFQGPHGNCFYLPGDQQQSILLIATGTGLAPLLGILHDALQNGHQGPIHLYHGSRTLAGLYAHEALHELVTTHSNVNYIPCLSGDDVPSGYRAGRAHEAAFSDHASLKQWRVYLCGNPVMVQQSKKQAYIKGADMKDIHGDPFELSDLRTIPRD